MGITSSKAKGSNITLVNSKSSNEELPNDSTATPLRKILPFDPRSPTENFSRTPIIVTASQDCSPTGAATSLNVKVLDVDPRSPSQQVSRTPIIVERNSSSTSDTPKTGGVKMRPHALDSPDKPSLTTGETDPRSPTVTVPRTPLEQKLFKVTIHDTSSSSNTVPEDESAKDENSSNECDDKDISTEEMEKENQPQNCTSRSDKQNKEGLVPTRSPLSGNNRNNCSTPRNLLQAKQCRTLEEEFTKNQRNILAQIVAAADEEETIVPSTTQFVEEI